MLRKNLPHNAQQQYLSSAGRHIPRAQAQRGDTIYWATNGNCRSGITHVAILKDARTMVNAPSKNTRVREQSIWTQSGSLRICPDAVRSVSELFPPPLMGFPRPFFVPFASIERRQPLFLFQLRTRLTFSRVRVKLAAVKMTLSSRFAFLALYFFLTTSCQPLTFRNALAQLE
jgi:hypothetical protein